MDSSRWSIQWTHVTVVHVQDPKSMVSTACQIITGFQLRMRMRSNIELQFLRDLR